MAVILNDVDGKNSNDELNNAQSLKTHLKCPVLEVPPCSAENPEWLRRLVDLVDVSATEPAPVG